MMTESNSKRFSVMHFIQDVRSETRKVTWPTRKETLVTTGMVFVMVIFASVFFLLSDMIIHWAVGLVLGFGRYFDGWVAAEEFDERPPHECGVVNH